MPAPSRLLLLLILDVLRGVEGGGWVERSRAYCVVEILNGEFCEALRHQHVFALGGHFFEAACNERNDRNRSQR